MALRWKKRKDRKAKQEILRQEENIHIKVGKLGMVTHYDLRLEDRFRINLEGVSRGEMMVSPENSLYGLQKGTFLLPPYVAFSLYWCIIGVSFSYCKATSRIGMQPQL